MTKKIDVFMHRFDESSVGYDLRILSEDVTLGDYVDALNEWQDETLAICRGCEACCFERIPLTLADFANARELAAATLGKAAEDVTIAEWISTCAICDLFDDGAVDIVFKRSMDGACFFLNRELGECRAHKHRSLVCQTHCCLPKTELAERLRAEAINCGEDELVRRLLMSEDCPEHLAECRVEDYAENGFSAVNPEDWRGIPLKTVVSDELWQLLLAGMQA